MDIAALQTLNSQILWASFALSVLFGGIAQRSQWLANASGLSPAATALASGLSLGLGFMLWALAGRGFLHFDNLLAGLGIVSVVGVVVSSAVCALASRSFRWEGFGGTEDTANHIVGAMLMGVGVVAAMGCTIGQGLSGISTLSATSFVVLAAILLGAVAGLYCQIWRLARPLQ